MIQSFLGELKNKRKNKYLDSREKKKRSDRMKTCWKARRKAGKNKRKWIEWIVSRGLQMAKIQIKEKLFCLCEISFKGVCMDGEKINCIWFNDDTVILGESSKRKQVLC